MTARNLLNILLLIMVIGLGIFSLWHSDDNSYLKLKLTQLKKDNIDKIIIPREKGDIILELSHSGWIMKKPYAVPAHDFRVNQLLNLTQIIAENSYDTTELDLTKFDLNPSDTKIIFNNTLLELGKSNPVNLLRYIKVNNRLYLAKENVYPLLRSQPSSFVALSLLPENTKIETIELPGIRIAKDKADNWQAIAAENPDPDNIINFIQNWTHASAFAIHAYMERKHLGQVHILSHDRSITFEITDNDPWLILARKDLGIEYHLDKSQVETLLKIPADTKPVSQPDA